MSLAVLKTSLLNLNLFDPPAGSDNIESDQQRRWNVLATRIYLVVLPLLLLAVVVVVSSSSETRLITVTDPGKEQIAVLPVGAKCPCSKISLSYGDFTEIQASFHQLCSSDFVSDRWIRSIYSASNSTYFSVKDFRVFGSAQFQALASFCRLTNLAVQQSIASFSSSLLLSSEVLSEAFVLSQTKLAIEQFQFTAPNDFASRLKIFLEIIAANKLISALQTNYILAYEIDASIESYLVSADPVIYQGDNHSACDCVIDLQCRLAAGFDPTFGGISQLEDDHLEILSGISSGCLPVSSILVSTLECFYNQTCLDKVISYFPTDERFTALSVSVPSQFSPNSSVQSIVDRLMVENWTTSISYDKYYAQCAPTACTYSQIQRHDFLFVLTKLISLLSGLTLALNLSILPLVQSIGERLQRPLEHEWIPQRTLRTRLLQIIGQLIKLLREANIFNQYPSTDRQILYQRYATRLYIWLLGISVGILATYTLLSQSTYSETVFHPTESDYLRLERAYPQSLLCLCTSISMPYSTFIRIAPQYHQLCSSDLISSQWILYSYSAYSMEAYYVLDYRLHAARQFQTLAMLCNQTLQTVTDAMQNFLQTTWVNSQVIQEQLFQAQIDYLFHQWNLSTVNQYTQTIELVRVTNQANQLMNRLNVFFYIDLNTSQTTVGPRTYDECNCAFFATCHTPMDIFGIAYVNSTRLVLYSIPNFFVGCFLIEALLLSTLECFYNRTCMLGLDQYLDSTFRPSLNYPSLNTSLSSPYETVQSLVNRLMVDSWSWNVNFSTYYNTCAPYSCVFEYQGRNDLVYVITVIIGVFGGLSIGFRMLILVGLRLMEKVRERWCATVSVRSIGRLFSCTNKQQVVNRLHLILVALALSVLYLQSALTPQLITIETATPSLDVYQNLSERFPDSLHCSCSQISIPYRLFLGINATFHPVCARDLIVELWNIYNGPQHELYQNITLEYGYSGAGQLQALVSLCQLSESIVSNGVLQLLASDLINTDVLSKSILEKQIQTVIDAFTVALPRAVVGSLSLIREITTVNMIMTTFASNWKFTTPPNLTNGWEAHTIPVQYPGCDCGLSPKCRKEISGVSIGCYILEAFLQSTLECLYDQECADRTHTYQALNTTVNPSRFPINSTFELVFDQLMVEELSHDISYPNYFAQCAPSVCVHSYINQSNLLEGITTLISLYGGLVIICRLLALAILKLLQRCTQKVHPLTS